MFVPEISQRFLGPEDLAGISSASLREGRLLAALENPNETQNLKIIARALDDSESKTRLLAVIQVISHIKSFQDESLLALIWQSQYATLTLRLSVIPELITHRVAEAVYFISHAIGCDTGAVRMQSQLKNRSAKLDYIIGLSLIRTRGITSQMDDWLNKKRCFEEEGENRLLSACYPDIETERFEPALVEFSRLQLETGIKTYVNKSMRTLETLADRSEDPNLEANVVIAQAYISGAKGMLTVDKEVAFERLIKVAKLGSISAKRVLGEYFQDKLGESVSMEYLREASDGCDFEAMRLLVKNLEESKAEKYPGELLKYQLILFAYFFGPKDTMQTAAEIDNMNNRVDSIKPEQQEIIERWARGRLPLITSDLSFNPILDLNAMKNL